MAFSLLISVRLDNIGCLGAHPSTVCCLLEKGAKTVTHRPAAGKLSVSVNIPQAVPWSKGGHTSSAVPVPLPWRSHCRFPKAPLPLPPAQLEAEQKPPPAVTNTGIDSSYSSQGGSSPGCKRLMCWFPLTPWKADKSPPFLSLFSCKLQEPSQRVDKWKFAWKQVLMLKVSCTVVQYF